MTRTMVFAVFTLLMLVAVGPSHAAKKTKWESLSDCQYIEAKDNDGDSFRVRCGAKGFVLRLYFVDAPETNLSIAERTRQQASHFGITLDETMRVGEKATEAVAKALAKPFVVHTRWSGGGGRSREPRYSALVEFGGKSLAEMLVSEGLARTRGNPVNLPDGEKGKAYIERLEALEKVAQAKRVGAWATTTRKDGAVQSK